MINLRKEKIYKMFNYNHKRQKKWTQINNKQ